MVVEVFSSNFDEALREITELSGESVCFDASGEVYPTEIVLCVTLIQGENLSATSVYASSDFDPKASSPTIQDLLAVCVDAIGTVYQPLLSPKKKADLGNILSTSLSSLENVPFEWTPVEVEKRRVYVKIDKANPRLDRMTDDWLAKNDPDYAERVREEETETEKLFVTGPGVRKSAKPKGPGTVH